MRSKEPQSLTIVPFHSNISALPIIMKLAAVPTSSITARRWSHPLLRVCPVNNRVIQHRVSLVSRWRVGEPPWFNAMSTGGYGVLIVSDGSHFPRMATPSLN